MLTWAGYNFVQKHRQRQELAAVYSSAPEAAHNSRSPASFGPATILPTPIAKTVAAGLEQEIAPPAALTENSENSCRFRTDCRAPDGTEKVAQLEKYRDFALQNCGSEWIDSCAAVINDLQLPPTDPRHQKAREIVVAACENDSLTHCEQVAIWEARDGNLEAAHDYANYACSKGDIKACQLDEIFLRAQNYRIALENGSKQAGELKTRMGTW